MKPITIMGFAAALAICATMAAAEIREQSFRLSLTIGGDNSQTRSTQFFADEVERISGGKMHVEVFPGGQLGGDSQAFDGLRGGIIDAQVTSTSYLGGIDPKFGIFDLPYLFRSFDEIRAVADGPAGDELRAAAQANNFVILNFHTGIWRNLTNNVRPVTSVADFQGLKVRTHPSEAFQDFWKALGAVPVAMPWSELYTALEQGTVDGQENVDGAIAAGKFYEIQKYYSETRHAPYVGVLLFSGTTWNRLNDDERAVSMEAGKTGADNWYREFTEEQKKLVGLFGTKMEVSSISEEGMANIHKAAAPVLAKHVAEIDAGLVEKVQSTLASMR